MRLLVAVAVILILTSCAPPQKTGGDDALTAVKKYLWPNWIQSPPVPPPGPVYGPPVLEPLPRVQEPVIAPVSPPVAPPVVVIPPPPLDVFPDIIEPELEVVPVPPVRAPEQYSALPAPPRLEPSVMLPPITVVRPKPPQAKPRPRRPKVAVVDDSGPDLPWLCWMIRFYSSGKTDAELEAMRVANGVPPLSPKQLRQAKACLAGVPR